MDEYDAEIKSWQRQIETVTLPSFDDEELRALVGGWQSWCNEYGLSGDVERRIARKLAVLPDLPAYWDWLRDMRSETRLPE
jgi:hypothetical protein